MTYMCCRDDEPEVPIRQVGVRELQKNASGVVRELVEAGEAAEITSRGRVIARLIPVSRAEHLIREMVAEGEMTPAMRPGGLFERTPLPPRADGRSATDALLAVRAEEPW
jgi:prevent-host-death family protein